MNRAIQDKTGTGLSLVRRPEHRVEYRQGLRDGSTGRIVFVPSSDRQTTGAKLHRVWAVAEVFTTAGVLHPTHDDKTVMDDAATTEELAVEAPKVELAFYRKYTEGLLRRYLRLSMQAGRVPSLLGRELFRGHVSHYTVHGLEDVVIFCHDVEQRLAKLNPRDKELIKRVTLQQYTREETAAMLGISLRTCIDRYDAAMDRLTGLLIEAQLLDPKNC